MDGTFSGCIKIEGGLTIDCNPLECSNLFAGAAVTAKVSITGKSNLIGKIIEERDNDNIKAD